MAKMRRFDNGGSVSEKPQGATRYDDRGRVIPLYEEDSGIVAQRASQAAPSYSTTQTPSDHFTNLPSGSNQQFNAMRSAIGLPSMEDSGSDDNDVNVQKAKDMMRSIVGLNPNTNNYSLQDAISQLKGQYSAPRRGVAGVANSDMNYGGGPGGGGMELPKNMGASIRDTGPPPVGPSSSEPSMPTQPAMPTPQKMLMPPPEVPEKRPVQQPVNDTGRVNPAIAALANAKLGNQMKNRGQSRYAPTAPQVPDQPMDYGNSGFDGGGGGGMKHGGKIKAFSKGGSTGRDGIAQRGKTKAFAKGGSVSASSRGDGCAQRGKTRGMMR